MHLSYHRRFHEQNATSNTSTAVLRLDLCRLPERMQAAAAVRGTIAAPRTLCCSVQGAEQEAAKKALHLPGWIRACLFGGVAPTLGSNGVHRMQRSSSLPYMPVVVSCWTGCCKWNSSETVQAVVFWTDQIRQSLPDQNAGPSEVVKRSGRVQHAKLERPSVTACRPQHVFIFHVRHRTWFWVDRQPDRGLPNTGTHLLTKERCWLWAE